MQDLEKILVVDDAPTICHFLKLLLEGAHYSVTVATSGESALAQMAKEQFDLIIVDKNLGDTDGLAVCRTARELNPDMARIIMTADPSVESAIAAVEEDIFSYLLKPLQKEHVLIKSRRALDRVRLVREREEARAEMQIAKEALEKRSQELEQTVNQLLHTQTRLLESEKLVSVGMLAAGVAHEINNPACFILPNLEYIKRGAKNLEQLATTAGASADKLASEVHHIDCMVDRCLQGVARIQKVVSTLQLFSRRDPVETIPIDLNVVCGDLLDIITHELGDRVKLEINLQTIPKVQGRPKEMALVVLNLLLNAQRSVFSKSTAEKQFIQLETGIKDIFVYLRVSDSGQPIALDTREQALDPLLLGRSAKGESQLSPHLNLSVVREIINRYGGELHIHSTDQGNTLEAVFHALA